jgi:putative acetyltransferase
VKIRPETMADAEPISALVEAAFATAEHSDGTEAMIVRHLRQARALAISLVAVDDEELVGHVALSPVTIDRGDLGWLGLGPVSVRPDWQGQGIGGGLIREALNRARKLGAKGCVVLGEPDYYGRFGFVADTRLRHPGPPAEYFQSLPFGKGSPAGEVAYHKAFG